jgi:hypothetical protein
MLINNTVKVLPFEVKDLAIYGDDYYLLLDRFVLVTNDSLETLHKIIIEGKYDKVAANDDFIFLMYNDVSTCGLGFDNQIHDSRVVLTLLDKKGSVLSTKVILNALGLAIAIFEGELLFLYNEYGFNGSKYDEVSLSMVRFNNSLNLMSIKRLNYGSSLLESPAYEASLDNFGRAYFLCFDADLFFWETEVPQMIYMEDEIRFWFVRNFGSIQNIYHDSRNSSLVINFRDGDISIFNLPTSAGLLRLATFIKTDFENSRQFPVGEKTDVSVISSISGSTRLLTRPVSIKYIFDD